MAVGLATVATANKLLDTLSNTSFAAGAVSALKLHTNTGDPGAAGTGNPSSVTTRPTVSWSAAASGSKTVSAPSSWTNWAGTNGEIIGYVSLWDSTTAGTFLLSIQLTLPKTVNTGDTVNVTITVSLAPLAA
jgi:hypothetical protein